MAFYNITNPPTHLPMKSSLFSAILCLFLLVTGCTDSKSPQADSNTSPSVDLITSAGFIYEEAPFPSAHASTIVETPEGMVAAWFGGTAEKDPDVGIWFSRHLDGAWTSPVEVANGVQSEDLRYPTWNPVLFQAPDGPLVLFYKAGPSPQEWWGLVRTSSDHGQTWSDEYRLPDGILGPIRAKPILIADGSLLAGSSTEHDGWVVHMERLKAPDNGEDMWDVAYLSSSDSWEKVDALNDSDEFGAIQPTILVHDDNTLQILCRSVQDVITEAWSRDGGQSWEPMQATSLPNPSAGVDVVKLQDGRFLLIYNPTTEGREQLGLAVSSDGINWSDPVLLENQEGEYSYPAIVQATDGMIHITYTWRREKVMHVVMEPEGI